MCKTGKKIFKKIFFVLLENEKNNNKFFFVGLPVDGTK